MADDNRPWSHEDDVTVADILRAREVGSLEAALSDKPKYVLMAYALYPNGTTAPVFLQDTEAAAQIGEQMGIGAPTDPMGWAIWEVPEQP